MRPLVCLFTLTSLSCCTTVACLAQQPSGPSTLEALLADETRQTATATEADANAGGPSRPAGTVSRPKDGVQHPDLDKAWADYEAAVAKNAEVIRAAINQQFDVATSKADLDAAEKWQAIGEKFEKAGALPTENETKTTITAAVADYKKTLEELSKAYEAVVKALTMDKRIAEAKAARSESSELQRGTANNLEAAKPDSTNGRRPPDDSRKSALMSRGITLATWPQLRDRDITTQQLPRKTTANSTSSHPGNYGPDNAVDGDALSEFAFLGVRGDLLVDFGTGVECSGLLLRSRAGASDICTHGFLKVDDSAPFPVKDFGGGRFIVVGLGRKQKVRKVLFHSDQGHFNPGISDILLIP
jgi:hypothetical protein